MLKSNMHIPTYAGLLNFYLILFYELPLNRCQMFLVTNSFVLKSILNNLSSLLTSFASILFLKSSIVLPFAVLFINLDNLFSSLLPFFSGFIFLGGWIWHIVLVVVIDWILTRDEFFLVLILASSKVASFNNEAHTFLYQKIEIIIF